jgi:putative ABC transport system substrate-binding protein
MFPRARKIGVFHDPRNSGPFVAEASKIALRRGVELVVRTVSSPREVPALLDGMRNTLDIFWMLPDPTVVNPETVDAILLFSFQNNVPVFSFSHKYVDMGAVAALQVSPFDMGAQAGEIAKALSAGGKGPMRSYANKYRFIINRKVAAKMGLWFSPDIMKKAE